jgi:predicted ester cyclase
MLSSQQMKEIFARYQTALMQKDSVALRTQLETILASDFIAHDLGETAGREELIRARESATLVFPDQTATWDILIAEGNLMAAHIIATGTHMGTFLGQPATGKKISMSIFEIVCTDPSTGLLKWRMGTSDQLAILKLLGATPLP